MADEKSITLNENHKRSLTSTLLIVEQLLIDIKDLMINPSQACTVEMVKDVENSIIDQNLAVVDEALRQICLLKEKYRTDRATQSMQRNIDAKKSKIWEVLHNSKSRRLKGFGVFPQKLIKEYDGDIDHLLAITENIKF
jgi:hypothetical protein